MEINFTKAEATGNDFIIIDNRKDALGSRIKDFGDFARFAARRRYSIGADAVLVLEDSKRADFRMRIFNPDGSEAEMCGNGIRSSALYAFTEKWCGEAMKIETKAGILEAALKGDSIITKMTVPENIRLDETLSLQDTAIKLHTLNTGVPHAVHFVEDIENSDVRKIGAKIRFHKRFAPLGTNADFVKVSGDSEIIVRTYERGVEDETLACGTGVVASAIIAHLVKGVKEPVSVVTRSGGVLKVHFEKGHDVFKDVYLEGKAYIVFRGVINYV